MLRLWIQPSQLRKAIPQPAGEAGAAMVHCDCSVLLPVTLKKGATAASYSPRPSAWTDGG